MLTNIVEKKFLEAFQNIEFGKAHITMPNGKTYSFEGKNPGAEGEMTIYDSGMIMNLYARGDIGFADDYRNGKWDSKDMVSLIAMCLANDEALEKCIFGSSIFRALVRAAYMFKPNTVRGSKANIHAHYDIGNSFYKLWLDDTMSYSSAIFNCNSESLAQAQVNKYDRILDRLHNNDNILEIGCGWGGFIERAIQLGGNDVKGVTISNEQYSYAKERNASYGGMVEMQDYRKLNGKYNNIVSIEMFEAVGEKYWKTYFDKISGLLANKGKAVIQTITIDDKHFDAYRKGGDAIRTFIFPGGMLPSPEIFKAKATESGLKTTDSYEFGQDYATTLKHWLQNFESKLPQIKNLGFDEKFIRLWRYYLAACAASFQVGRTNVMQMELQHA